MPEVTGRERGVTASPLSVTACMGTRPDISFRLYIRAIGRVLSPVVEHGSSSAPRGSRFAVSAIPPPAAVTVGRARFR